MNYPQLLALFKETHLELQQRAARSVDTSLVIRNWLFGWYIVEFEQGGGAERSELYGKGLINRLSRELKTLGLKGISSTNLKQCRMFYLAYQKIGQTPSDQSFEMSVGLHCRQSAFCCAIASMMCWLSLLSPRIQIFSLRSISSICHQKRS